MQAQGKRVKEAEFEGIPVFGHEDATVLLEIINEYRKAGHVTQI